MTYEKAGFPECSVHFTGLTFADMNLIQSTSGTRYAGTVVNRVAVVFPVDLGDFAGVTYEVPVETEKQLITGLVPNGGYNAEVTNAGGSMRVSVRAGSQYKADAGGVLVIGTLP